MRLGLIYKLSVGNYFIIGSTINFNVRKSQYKSKLQKNTHNNSFLQDIYNKYKELNFEILQSDIPEDILEHVEDIWIGASCGRAEDRRGGMNVRDAYRVRFSEEIRKKMSNSKLGKKPSEETKLLMSKSHKNIIHNKTWNNNVSKAKKGKKLSQNCYSAVCVKVVQFDLDNNFIKIWNSTIEATLNYSKRSSANILSCCKGNQKTAYGFKWKYYSDYIQKKA